MIRLLKINKSLCMLPQKCEEYMNFIRLYEKNYMTKVGGKSAVPAGYSRRESNSYALRLYNDKAERQKNTKKPKTPQREF